MISIPFDWSSRISEDARKLVRTHELSKKEFAFIFQLSNWAVFGIVLKQRIVHELGRAALVHEDASDVEGADA